MKRIAVAAGFIMAMTLVGGPSRAEPFTPCEDAGEAPELAGSLCAIVETPLDHNNDESGTIDLFVRKFPAIGESRGEVWLVAGGPGESGASFYPFLATLRRAFPGMDLIAPDHRGTGYSTKLCPEQEAPESDAGIALAGSEWGPCIGAVYQDQARAHAFTITNAAHDLSGLITTHRGEGEVHLYAVSYGTQLALRMMAVAPTDLDGLVLDGLVPPETTTRWDLSRRSEVVDQVGRRLLSPAETAQYEAVLAGSPAAWAEAVPGGNLKQFMGSLLNFPELRARIPAIIAELSEGEIGLLLSTVEDRQAALEAMTRFRQSPPSAPLVILISTSENNARPDLTEDMVREEAEGALFTSPLPGFLAGDVLPPYERDNAFGNLPETLPRTLVVQGTRDPNTPYEGALDHVRRLETAGPVSVATVEGGAHLLLFVAPECFVGAVRPFINGETAPGTCTAP